MAFVSLLVQGCTDALALCLKAKPVGVFHCQNLGKVFKKGDRCALFSDSEALLLTADRYLDISIVNPYNWLVIMDLLVPTKSEGR